jgi:predicted nucleic acid-binding protein
MNAVDTNIFAYSFDPIDPAKQSQARLLIGDLARAPADTILIWQVAGELLSCLRKWESAGRLSTADVEVHFRGILALFPIRHPTAAVFEISFDLRSRFSPSHWDSMLLAASKEAGVDTLYSEDMDAGTNFDGLRVVNPFA